MSTEGKHGGIPNRRRFFGCAAGALGVAAAPLPPGTVRRILPEQIYATYEQKGIKPFPDWEEKRPGRLLGEILDQAGRNGSSNVFLVQGEGIEDALGASHKILCCGAGAETAFSPDTTLRPVWLVAFLGNARSVPQEWTVEGIEVEHRQIRMNYRTRDRSQPVEVTSDRRSYCYWASLPKLTSAVYAVELFDLAEKVVTLSRRVRIE